MQAALQDRPDALDSIRVGRATRIFPRPVVDGGMVEEKPVKVTVGPVLISVELGPNFHRAVNLVLDRLQPGIRYDHGDSATATFTHPQDGDFTNRPATRLELF